jgi:transcriptional regulator with XRE-family HTH domain
MGRRRPDRTPLVERELHLGAWLARLGVKQIRLAEELNITPGYMSEIVSGKKNGADIDLWMDIAHVLGIPLEALFRRPPDSKAVASVEGLSDAVIAKLSRRRA